MRNSPDAEKARNRWRQSPEAREAARRAARKALRIFANAPKCGARTRDGMICQSPGLGAGGRCRIHGGATPCGDNWHKPVFPKDMRRHANKVESLRIREEKRQARLAAMTPEERAKYERRRLSYQPGTKTQRAARREERRRKAEAREAFARPGAKTTSPEVATLEAIIDTLRRKIALLEQQQQQEARREPAAGYGLFD